MTKSKSFETHWQLLICQGIISLVIGWLILFLDKISAQSLIVIAAITLLLLGLSDLVHLFIRRRHQEGWGISLLSTSFEILMGAALLITTESEMFWQILILATYTFVRGVFDLVFAFKSLKDSTDKFIWAASGICGCVIGFVILNASSFVEETLFIHIFGTYLMIFGLSNLIYGIHNKNLAGKAQPSKGPKASKVSKKSKKKSGGKNHEKTN